MTGTKGAFLIDSGVEEANAPRPRRPSGNSWPGPPRRDFTPDDLESARLSVKKSVSLPGRPSLHPGGLVFGPSRRRTSLSTPEQAAAEIDAVTAAQAADAARSLTLQTVFLLVKQLRTKRIITIELYYSYIRKGLCMGSIPLEEIRCERIGEHCLRLNHPSGLPIFSVPSRGTGPPTPCLPPVTALWTPPVGTRRATPYRCRRASPII